MSIIAHPPPRGKMATPPPPTIPILPAALGPLIGRTGERYIIVACPRCGRRNRHGWPARTIAAAAKQHRTAHCRCWPRGYYIAPAATAADPQAAEGQR